MAVLVLEGGGDKADELSGLHIDHNGHAPTAAFGQHALNTRPLFILFYSILYFLIIYRF